MRGLVTVLTLGMNDLIKGHKNSSPFTVSFLIYFVSSLINVTITLEMSIINKISTLYVTSFLLLHNIESYISKLKLLDVFQT